MRLTRQQIERMADAVRNGSHRNGDVFALEQTESGQIRFYVIETVEQKTPIPIGVGKAKT